jgi:hypothetical protein
MSEHREKAVGERRTPSDDLVEGRLVEPGDSVLLGDRIVDSGADCGEAQDDQPAHHGGDNKERVRSEVARERSQGPKAGAVMGRRHVRVDPWSDRGRSRRYPQPRSVVPVGKARSEMW